MEADMKYVLALCLVLTVACSTSSPVAPASVVPATHTMAYAINIPDAGTVQGLTAQYPQGVALPPLDAQARWDYTHAYSGTPNVYYGPTAPPCQNFLNTSVVIAPEAVARLQTFTASDWPGAHLDMGVTYEWRGYFAVSYPARPGTYVPCVSR